MSTIGENMRKIRLKQSLSQEKLGEISGVQFQQIQRHENGRSMIPADKLFKVAKALGVDIKEFNVEGEDDMDQDTLIHYRKRARLLSRIDELPEIQRDAFIGIMNGILNLKFKNNN